MISGSRIVLAPLVDIGLWWALAALAALTVIAHALRARRGRLPRAAAASALLLMLLNPSIVREVREQQADIVALVLDRSDSMRVGGRDETARRAFEALRARLQSEPGIEVRATEASEAADATQLFAALRASLADAPRARLGATILVTDGQVHDVPAGDALDEAADSDRFGPVHAVIVGREDIADRRIEIVSAPAFGVVGEQTEIGVRIRGAGRGGVAVTMSVNGETYPPVQVENDAITPLEFEMPRRGDNLVLLEIPAAPGEASTVNNVAGIEISGIRDRLLVLLVTGKPHAGGRAWRDLLKSDPSVELVHFTILRPPHKDVSVPRREMALIAFPSRELFVRKLPEFDLVIFDQYRRLDVLTMTYFDNIAGYVENGGALLVTAGIPFAGRDSIYRTSLASVLPVRPDGRVMDGTIRARRSELGRRHAVTAQLPDEGAWGSWYRHIGSIPASGNTLIETEDEAPLLVLDRVGEGRVAALMSDQLWLWARGHDGGGPYGELIRRTAHWLMREPELEEEKLELNGTATGLEVRLRSLRDSPPPLSLTDPAGASTTPEWIPEDTGRWRAEREGDLAGVWRAEAGDLRAVGLKGTSNPREYKDLRASSAALAPIVNATGGGLFDIDAGGGVADIRRVSTSARSAAGRDWIGVRRNRSYTVRDLRNDAAMPAALVAALIVGLMMAMWWSEGRRSTR